jgi:hypothetical protein
MPAMDSMAVAAIAMPYSPPSSNEVQIEAHTASTGRAVERIETARPAMMLVACPVSEAAATLRTGPNSVAV